MVAELAVPPGLVASLLSQTGCDQRTCTAARHGFDAAAVHPLRACVHKRMESEEEASLLSLCYVYRNVGLGEKLPTSKLVSLPPSLSLSLSLSPVAK